MFNPFNGTEEWCFVDTARPLQLRYFNGNRSYENVVREKVKIVAYSGNDFIKHQYYNHYFEPKKDKKWLNIFLGE
jgi:hypothetical protein